MILIPKPKDVKMTEGKFVINSKTKILLMNNLSYEAYVGAKSVKTEIDDACGISIDIYKCLEASKGIVISFDENMENEEYTLSIIEQRVSIIGGEAGAFYGMQTLRQIIKQFAPFLPACEIIDSPCFKVRGVYHDITRGKVPTLDTLKSLIDRLSQYKINQFQFYIEHAFPFDFATEMWSGKGYITPEEVIELDEYCRQRYIELVPSIATFGHFYDLLVTNEYQHLSELVDSTPKMDYWTSKAMHHTIDAKNPGSFSLIKKILDQYMPLFSSSKFNICCDETFDLGKGKNRETCEKDGAGRLYVDFLKKVMSYVKLHGKQPMFWGDVIIKHPELMNEIDKDAIALNWNYNAIIVEGNSAAFEKSGFEQYSCSSTMSHSVFVNRLTHSFKNTLQHIIYSKKYGATGMLITDWGDNGHISPIANSIPSMIYAMSLAWNSNVYANEKEFAIFDTDLSKLEYSEASGSLIGILRKAGDSSKIDWLQLVFRYYDRMGWYSDETKKHIWIEKHYQEGFIKPSDLEIIESYNQIMDCYYLVSELYKKISYKNKEDSKAMMVSIKGLALSNALLLVIKKYDFKQDVKLIIEPKALAIEFELWFEEFSVMWRNSNKESELFRVKDAIFGWCNILREMMGNKLI